MKERNRSCRSLGMGMGESAPIRSLGGGGSMVKAWCIKQRPVEFVGNPSHELTTGQGAALAMYSVMVVKCGTRYLRPMMSKSPQHTPTLSWPVDRVKRVPADIFYTQDVMLPTHEAAKKTAWVPTAMVPPRWGRVQKDPRDKMANKYDMRHSTGTNYYQAMYDFCLWVVLTWRGTCFTPPPMEPVTRGPRL